MYHLYILLCANGSLYTGITTDVARRFKEHKDGKGGRYTRSRAVRNIAYTEPHPDRSSALKREAEVKSWNKKRKQALIASTKQHGVH